MSDVAILWQGEGLLAVDKPAGWLTVPSRFADEDPRKVLGREVEKARGVRIFPVHRLDQEVSGLVLFATDGAAQRRANAWFEKRQVRKTYEAYSGPRDFAHWPANLPKADAPISDGEWQEWRSNILRGKRRSYEHAKGDLAITQARRRQENPERLAWDLRPLTGRSHQLRFEMSRHGYPILGDELYGSKANWPEGIALRAVELDFSGVKDRGDLPERLAVKGLFA